MVNHSHMTRLISELLTNERGIHLHISSLDPIRPANKPDDWERQALVHFLKGGQDESSIIGTGDASVFRFIAPLRSDERCLTCHPSKNGVEEPIRGGITVLFSYAPFQQAIAAERKQNITVHSVFFLLGIGLIALMGGKLVHNIAALQDSLLRIKRLEGFLPICAHCKKIRQGPDDNRDQSAWVAIETYIQDRTDAEFTHGLCPQCAQELYPTLFKSRAQ